RHLSEIRRAIDRRRQKPWSHDPILILQKFLESFRQKRDEFLPGKHLAPHLHLRRLDRRHNPEPCLAQIWTTLVMDHTETRSQSMGRQYIANELITRVSRVF